ncbi:seryl-trna synthetase [Thalassiosira pseudonana CCMP1335]|uniref:serine--tRNA ligase n=1 Tax=Thalassiosira pseudonana TaxID=35128 RepID=B8C7Q8_THAPS|nr:seryl-trna synthetase [Thalassiosira pseudonana CCMP1335]EED90361.1 seryl-trna synthetase [Thalassiosira pseudonana CCMP1335]|eukprot:scaffold13345_cov209-Alexandrium_tamarense.AAC.22
MPIDINSLRTYKGGAPELYRQYMQQRFKDPTLVDAVLAKDEAWREIRASIDSLRQQVNKLQKEVIAPKKKAKEPCEEEVKEMKSIQAEIKRLEAELPVVADERDALLNRIGNIVDPEVPISDDEDADNLVVSLYPEPLEAEQANGDKPPLLPASLSNLSYTLPPTKPLTHDDLLWRIDGYEPIRGQNVAGHRGYFLKNAGVLLNQALINYGIAFLRKRGYQVLQPPYFMNKDVMSGIAQLEDFDEQLYKVSGKTDDPENTSEKYLIATSEQPICAYHKNEWIDDKALPFRYAGISTCFRKEAGSSGRDIRGIFRVHQFEKIEQFCVVVDDFEESSKEQTRMIDAAKEFYESLGFPYRVVCIVSGALNDAAVKKYDLEAWFPGQQAYRELVSCSNCTDYQARGVGARCGQKKTDTNKSKTKEEILAERASYVHFLNATLCATGRGICCLLENYQEENGVRVPEVLVPFMGGIDFLPFERGPMEMSKSEKKQKEHEQKQQK